MKKNIVAAAVAALALPVAAGAADSNFSYTYAELGYVDLDVNGAGTDGFSLEGSFEFTELLFGFAGYEDLSGDFDYTNLTAGIGAAIALNDRIDGFARIAFVDNETGFADDTGIGLEAGVRASVMENLEAFGSFSYVDIYDDSQTGFELGARYWLQDNLGISLAYNDIEDADGFTLAARFNF